jgi:amino acid transporter
MVLGSGTGVPGVYLAVGLTLLLFSVGYTAMSNKVTNAGAFFSYVGRGLGIRAGVASAFASVLGYVVIQLAIYGFFGGVTELTMAEFGINAPWYVWTIGAWVFVTLLSLLSVDVGAKILGVLLSLEVLVLIIAGVAMLIDGGPEGWNFSASFDPTIVFAGGFAGTAGIAIAFAFASFIGFEATAIYGEESKDPKKTVPRATYWAIGIISGLFAVVTFAMVTGMGASNLIDEVLERSDGLEDPAGVLFSLADQYVGGWLMFAMIILVVTSLFAGLLAFQNASARYWYAMGRGKVFPAIFGSTNKSGAPQAGALATSVIALVVMVVFAIAGLHPILNMFFWFSAVAVVAIFFVEILVSIAVVAFFRREGGANIWKSTIAPIGAAILLTIGLYLLMARFNLLSELAPAGVDPSLPESAWQLSPLGWVLVLLPFAVALLGVIVATVKKLDRSAITQDIMS